jgi:hypothetical protein
MARQSGCADEAWDLVMEFVASETDPVSDDTCLSCFDAPDGSLLGFETPTEAMLQCLANDSAGVGESQFPEWSGALEAEERLGDSLFPALMDSELSTPSGAPCAEGFSHDLLSLLEQLLAEALTTEEADELEESEEQVSPFGWNPPRGTES